MYRKKVSLVWMSALTMFVAIAIGANSASAQTEKVLHTFGAPGDGYNPAGGLVFDSEGNLFGPTSSGGTGAACGSSGCGTVFQLQPNPNGSWSETIIHSFDGTDGAHPSNPLIFDGQGNLYGTAACDLSYCYYEVASPTTFLMSLTARLG